MAKKDEVKEFAKSRIGFVLDRKYEIIQYIGHGGMSIVYRASDRRLNKTWAVKEFRKTGEQMKDEVFRKSLLKEANLMKGLDHRALPRIVDIIEADDTIFIVMDFIEGEDLKALMKRQGHPMSQEDVIDWGIQLCDVLNYLHTPDPKKGKPQIVYRDMKPENVMLKDDGSVCLIDFGIAKQFDVTKEGDTTILGTREYAAPEQLDPMVNTDWRADIYSLGITLHYLVTGHNPKKNIFQTRPITEYNPSLSRGLEKVIEKCVSYNRDDRYQSCVEVAYDLENHWKLDEEYIEGLRKKVKRFAALAIATAVFLVIGIGGMALSSAERASTFEAYKSAGDNIALTEDSLPTDASYIEKVQAYENAIAVDPSVTSPYDELLRAFIIDGDFSAEEAASYYNLLDNYARGTCSDYATLCYNFANVYFNYTTNYSQASTWFTNAIEAGGLSDEMVANAETYIDICDFRKDLGSRDVLGNSGESEMFVAYWNNLGEACNRIESANVTPRSKLKLYELIVDACSSEAYTIPLMVGGLSQKDLDSRVDYALEQTRGLSSQIASAIDRELYDYILIHCTGEDGDHNADPSVETAYQVIERTYSSTYNTAKGDSTSSSTSGGASRNTANEGRGA